MPQPCSSRRLVLTFERAAASVLRHIADLLPTSDVVVLSDYAKGVLSDAVLQGVLAQAQGAHHPIDRQGCRSGDLR